MGRPSRLSLLHLTRPQIQSSRTLPYFVSKPLLDASPDQGGQLPGREQIDAPAHFTAKCQHPVERRLHLQAHAGAVRPLSGFGLLAQVLQNNHRTH